MSATLLQIFHTPEATLSTVGSLCHLLCQLLCQLECLGHFEEYELLLLLLG
ncbi:MAG: hypothetical protein FWG75_08430 [Cystobacterineae bacterium]|nr:hypothetical protein [Cystobacterineae bacterium]